MGTLEPRIRNKWNRGSLLRPGVWFPCWSLVKSTRCSTSWRRKTFKSILEAVERAPDQEGVTCRMLLLGHMLGSNQFWLLPKQSVKNLKHLSKHLRKCVWIEQKDSTFTDGCRFIKNREVNILEVRTPPTLSPVYPSVIYQCDNKFLVILSNCLQYITRSCKKLIKIIEGNYSAAYSLFPSPPNRTPTASISGLINVHTRGFANTHTLTTIRALW